MAGSAVWKLKDPVGCFVPHQYSTGISRKKVRFLVRLLIRFWVLRTNLSVLDILFVTQDLEAPFSRTVDPGDTEPKPLGSCLCV